VQGEPSRRAFRLGVAGASAVAAAFLVARLHAWPPHEDEALALLVGSKPLDELLSTVLDVRGGAPLHFLLVHAVTAISPTHTAVRLLSVVLAVASIPAGAALVARLADRRTGLVAAVLVSASWVTLFHGIYARMYGLFALTSALSFLALLRAIDRNGRGSWALWAVAAYATLASHQYGVFVLGAQVAYVAVLRWKGRARLLPGGIALGAVLLAAIPLWRSNLVLASRFDLGVGDGGTELGGPLPVLEYLRSALGDFVAGWTILFVVVAGLAGVGLVVLARTRPASALLAALVVAVPAAGLALARVGGGAAAPETRHLIFVLPFFAMLVAAGLVRVTRLTGSYATGALAFGLTLLVASQVAWGWHQTPALYVGEPEERKELRELAEEWLARTSRPDDVLFAYDPLVLGTRERGGVLGNTVVPRADPKLALDALLDAPQPLGRGVWILDASDGARIVGNHFEPLAIETRSPGAGFEAKAFGPFLIVRTTEPTVTPGAFLRDTERVQQMGLEMGVSGSGLHLETARVALEELENAG
jgi:hypothetical protein